MSEEQTPAENSVEVSPADLPVVEEAPSAGPGGQLDILLDASLEVSATLGEVEMEVRHLLQLGPGSVVKLDRKAGEPVDLIMRGVKFARGTLVVIGDQLGVRIKEILPPNERAK